MDKNKENQGNLLFTFFGVGLYVFMMLLVVTLSYLKGLPLSFLLFVVLVVLWIHVRQHKRFFKE